MTKLFLIVRWLFFFNLGHTIWFVLFLHNNFQAHLERPGEKLQLLLESTRQEGVCVTAGHSHFLCF